MTFRSPLLNRSHFKSFPQGSAGEEDGDDAPSADEEAGEGTNEDEEEEEEGGGSGESADATASSSERFYDVH